MTYAISQFWTYLDEALEEYLQKAQKPRVKIKAKYILQQNLYYISNKLNLDVFLFLSNDKTKRRFIYFKHQVARNKLKLITIILG